MRQRERLAIFSPVHPVKSGISDYTETMLPYLCDRYDVELFVDGYQPDCHGLIRHIPVFQRRDYEWRRQQFPYDINLYHIGNSTYHQYIYPVLFRVPGVVILHDANLHRARALEHLQNQNIRFYLDELAYCHGEHGRKVGQLIARGYVGDLLFDRFPMLNLVCEAASRVIVHSRYAARKVARMIDSNRISIVPAPVIDTMLPEKKEARRCLRIPENDIVIASFGFITHGKGLESSLEAFVRLLETCPNSQYILVGDALDISYRNHLMAAIPERISPRVKITGYLEPEEFQQYLAASDICVNLRYPTQGETSSAVLRIMGAGKPVIVPWYRQFIEIPPDTCVHVDISPDETTSVFQALMRLISDKTYRQDIEEHARQYIMTHHSIREWIDRIIDELEAEIRAGSRPLPLSKRCPLDHVRVMPLEEQLAVNLNGWSLSPDQSIILSSLESTIEEFIGDE